MKEKQNKHNMAPPLLNFKHPLPKPKVQVIECIKRRDVCIPFTLEALRSTEL